MNYHLATSTYILPFPFLSSTAALAHAAYLGGGYVVVPVSEVAVDEDDYETTEYELSLETEMQHEQENWGTNYDERLPLV